MISPYYQLLPTITLYLINYSHRNTLFQLFINWKIKIDKSKTSYVTFSLRPHYYPAVSINNIINLRSTKVKYLDKYLTWSLHLKHKRKKLNTRLHLSRPLLRSSLLIPFKITPYKTLLHPIWTYGIVRWGSAKSSDKRTIQVFQNIC